MLASFVITASPQAPILGHDRREHWPRSVAGLRMQRLRILVRAGTWVRTSERREHLESRVRGMPLLPRL